MYLTNLDGRQWLLFVYLSGMIALLPICIALAFLPTLPDPCVTKEMSLWTNTTCVSMELSAEIRNHRDIGKREDIWGDNLRLSHELFDVIVVFVSLYISFFCLFAPIFVHNPRY
ncbi:hypothetical protein NPIL_311541 [Nephila pilipes]|uniref:Uncharacterized protein n=1 Tax=Nephila pilipes TaxID=299642 RepID=A0A8X6TSV0_NEPPI|nr:hypothetical protein NPIL_311541 [Nephila pilipes]